MSTLPILQITQLEKWFNDQLAVSINDMTIQKGEIYGFLGLNGAGKTTTMKIILSLMAPSSGSIMVAGVEITTSKSYLNHIGSMIEEPSYYPNLTAYENLLVFQKMLGFDEANIQETLDLVGLGDSKNRKKLVKNFSLGMKQRLALAFALVKKPEILLLDEPTNGLDPSGIHDIRELIKKLAKKEGMTILISSHILSEVEQVADRVGIIHRGHLVYQGDIETIKANRWLEIYGDFSQIDIESLISQGSFAQVLEKTSQKVKLTDLSDEAIASLINYLVASGVSLYHVSRERDSLEDIFLTMTKEGL